MISVGTVLVVVVALVVSLVVGIARDSAPAVAKAYIVAINDGDCAKARSVVVPDLAEQIGDDCGVDTAKNGKYEIGTVEYTINGSTASARATLTRSDGSMTVIFREIKDSNGKWVIENIRST